MLDKLTPAQYAVLWKKLGRMSKWRNVVREFGDSERQPGLRVRRCPCRRRQTEVFVMDYPVQVEVYRHKGDAPCRMFRGGGVCLACDFGASSSHPVREE